MLHIIIILIGLSTVRLLHYAQIKYSKRIIVMGILLTLFGVFALYSVSIQESFKLTLGLIQSGKIDGKPSNYYYFYEQIKNMIIGLVVAAAVYFVPIKAIKNKNTAIIVAIFVVILQLLVFTPLGKNYNGALGWINIPIIGNLQPAEFFKLGFVMFFSWWLVRKVRFMKEFSLYIAMAIILGIIGIIFMFIPDLGSMLVIAITACVMAIYIGAKMKYLLMLAGGGMILAIGAVFAMPTKFEYIQKRFATYISSEKAAEQRDKGYRQQLNGIISVGGGGVMGQGYGKGIQKLGNIPEAPSDFIFAAFSEEIGFIGNLYLLSLYGFLGRYAIIAVQNMKDTYRQTLSIGIISLILVQMFINIGVNIGILPNTGITLPFVSHGGTALLINMVEIILLYRLIENK